MAGVQKSKSQILPNPFPVQAVDWKPCFVQLPARWPLVGQRGGYSVDFPDSPEMATLLDGDVVIFSAVIAESDEIG